MNRMLALLLGASFLFASPAYAQDGGDPLAQFRIEPNSTGEFDDDSDNAADDAIAAPMLGDFQDTAPGASYGQYALDPNMSIEEQQAEIEQKMRETAYEAALNGLMPMKPDEIRMFLEKYGQNREASEQRLGGVPKPEVKIETVSLDPGVTPPVIKLSTGHVTSLTLLDITGQPWPVRDVTWGGSFEVISPGEGGHVIRINPMGSHEVGNMSIQLVDLKTPVTFTLQAQNEVVQYRFDARIPEYGPLAEAPLIDSGPAIMSANKDKDLTSILGGIVPQSSEMLNVTGVDNRTKVYRANGKTYLRTPLTLLSPAWNASVKSSDGMTVYSIGDAPVLLLSDRGRMVRAVVEKPEKSY